MRLTGTKDVGVRDIAAASSSHPRARSLADTHIAEMLYPRQAPSSSSAASSSSTSSRPSASTSSSSSASAASASPAQGSNSTSSNNGTNPNAGNGGASNSSPASGSLNSTRIVLGRGFANGQLTYTVPITAANQQINAQLDTGSGDLWLANQDCDTDSCKGHQGLSVVKFNDHADSVVDQDTPFNISYLLGSAEGKVKTASMLFGDSINSRLIINSQAFGSCDQVNNEDMDSGNFSGIIGVGPPANSLIQADLNSTSNTAWLNVGVPPPETGAVLAGFWNNARPGRRFMGIGLQRLEEDGGKGDSVLTIGNHDPAYAGSANPDLNYTDAIGDADGVVRHWRVRLTDISVELQHSITEPIPVGTSSVISGSQPIAVFDSGASINLGPESTLNALYGAWGIGPASDGGYYVPCDLQMNITLGFGNIHIPIHPLDASLEIGSSSSGPSYGGSACLGSFQALRSLSGSSSGSNLNSSFLPADFVLSPAFMRSAYTVFSCDGGLNTTQAAAAGMTVTSPCQAAIGLRSLVNMTTATQQFTTVRIKKQSLGQSGLHGGGHPSSGSGDSKGLSEGIKVVIGCVCAIIVIAVLFGVALWRLRRRRRRIAAARAAILAGQGEKRESGAPGKGGALYNNVSGGHSKKQSNPYSVVKIDGLSVPMEILGKDDDSSSQVVLSPAQRAKTRQLNHIHGVYDEELHDDEAGRGMGPQWGEEVPVVSNNHLQAAGMLSWDVSSTGYVDARQVKNAYLASLTPDERRAFLQSSPKQQEQELTTSIHNQLQSLDEGSVQVSQSQQDARSDSGRSSQYQNRNSARASSPAPLLMHDELRE